MTKLATRQAALQVLRLLNLFNEKEIYGLVLDYLFTTCTMSPDLPWNPWNGAAGGRGFTVVGGPAFTRGFFGARFCFTSPATFEKLRVVDIGLTRRTEPFDATHPRGYIDHQDATFFTAQSYEAPYEAREWSYTTVHHQMKVNQGNQQSHFPKCSTHNTLAYAEIIYECENQRFTVNLSCIDHVTESPMFLTRSMDIPQEFHCCPLYPFLSLRIPPPFAISIHSIL